MGCPHFCYKINSVHNSYVHIFFIFFLHLVNRIGQICNAHQTQNFENKACITTEHQHKPNPLILYAFLLEANAIFR